LPVCFFSMWNMKCLWWHLDFGGFQRSDRPLCVWGSRVSFWLPFFSRISITDTRAHLRISFRRKAKRPSYDMVDIGVETAYPHLSIDSLVLNRVLSLLSFFHSRFISFLRNSIFFHRIWTYEHLRAPTFSQHILLAKFKLNLELIGLSYIQPQTSNQQNQYTELSNSGLFWNLRLFWVGISMTGQIKSRIVDLGPMTDRYVSYPSSSSIFSPAQSIPAYFPPHWCLTLVGARCFAWVEELQ
jgi:hypothetical protein